MRKKEDKIKRRLRVLVAVGVISAVLAVITGWYGFFHSGEESGRLDSVADEYSETICLPEEADVLESTEVTQSSTDSNMELYDNYTEEHPDSTSETTSDGIENTIFADESLGAEATTPADEVIEETEGVNPDVINCADSTNVEESFTLNDEVADPLEQNDLDDLPLDTTPSTPECVAEELISAGDNAPQGEEKCTSAQEWIQNTEVDNTQDSAQEKHAQFKTLMRTLSCTFFVIFITDAFLIVLICKNVRAHNRRPKPYAPTQLAFQSEAAASPVVPTYLIPGISIGKSHGIGNRDYQQDSFGQTAILDNCGVLAVLADGMGGLSQGEKVSQRIVMEALNYGVSLKNNNLEYALNEMLGTICQSVNHMLGPDGLYKSGSTVVSVLISGNKMHWISVGDSRIYLYRNRYLNQLSRDHDLFQLWMPEILDGTRSLVDSINDPEGRKLTSFVGMGDIRFVDRSYSPITLLPGDRILLMSDGIYGTVPDSEIEAILRGCPEAQSAADQIAQRVSLKNLPYQDNYTLVILGYDPIV